MTHRRQEFVLGATGEFQLDIFLAQLVFAALAARYVADRAGDERGFAGVHGTETDLDRELAAIFAPAFEVQTDSHRPHARVRKIALAMTGMSSAERPRQQDLDRLSQQLGARVSEQSFGLGIDKLDFSLAVDNDNRVGCGLQQRAELLLGAYALAHVTHSAHHKRSSVQ